MTPHRSVLVVAVLASTLVHAPFVRAQSPQAVSEREGVLLKRIDELERRLATLEAKLAAPAATPSASLLPSTSTTPAVAPVVPAAEPPFVRAATEKAAPFAFGDFTWVVGNSRQKDYPLATKSFTGEVRVDTNYVYSFHRPRDHTLIGSSELGRTNEVQLQQFGNRLWFHNDRFGVTLGGGAITNPGRYLVLIPPINGASAFSGTQYFTANRGDKFRAWDASLAFDYMPTQFTTWRFEYNHRAANVPYFAGRGGSTPPGGNTGAAGSLVPGFAPDLRKRENRLTAAFLLKL